VGGNIAFFCYILKAIGNADEIKKSEKEKTMQRIYKTLFFMTALLPFGVMAKVSVTNPTIIATQQAGEPSAIFMELHNSDNQAVNLAMVQSSQPANLVLHGTQNGKMITTTGIEIPAKGKVQLKPGGLHIMVFDSAKALRAGERFPLTLMFDNGEKVAVDAAIVGH